MENEIIISDMHLALLLQETLAMSGNRNPKYNKALHYNKFTLEELATITSLKLKGSSFKDISALKYCVNLKDLSIISANAKNIKTKFSDEAKHKYLMGKNDIKDFSVINDLTNLESLTIAYDDNLTNLNVSNLRKLDILNLSQNSNLTEVRGLENAANLSELILYRNNISHSFDLQDMVENGMLSSVKLDFDMYPILKKEYPDIDKFISKQQKNNGFLCKWQENLSNISTNEISTSRINEMDKKAQEILQSIINPDYNDIEKVAAIYAYMIQNVEYDYESLAAAKRGEKNSAYEEAKNNLGENINTILNRRQSSYNAILKGKGVCEGYTNMMHYLLKSVGIDSKTVSCSVNMDKSVVGADSNHSVIKALIEGEWYYFDPTWDAGKNVLSNFLKTKEEFSENHVLSMTENDVISLETKAYSNEELISVFNKVIEDRESKKREYENAKKETVNYERQVSSRDGVNYSEEWQLYKKQDMNKSHEYSIYHGVRDFDNKTFEYSLGAPYNTQDEYFTYIGDKLGEEYSKGETGESAELAKNFAKLEVNGKMGDFENPYDSGYETSGYDNPKLLLQLEKVKGLNIEELEDAIGLDTSELHQDIYVATYEIEEWDSTLNKNMYKPIKEYYKKDENGEITIIGTGTEENIKFTIDGVEFDIETDKVMQGETTEKVTQQQLSDKLMKNGIEESLKNGKVTSVVQITDMSFLQEFAEQCEIPENWNLLDRTFIVSTINEKGEEDFDIIIRNDGAGDTEYEHLVGINATEKSKREIYTTTGQMVSGNLSGLDKTKTLKEFVTKSGHKYAITRNDEGKLGFNEIFRENENIIQAQHVDAYTFSPSPNDFIKDYQNAQIHEGDLEDSAKTIKNTIEKRKEKQAPNKV